MRKETFWRTRVWSSSARVEKRAINFHFQCHNNAHALSACLCAFLFLFMAFVVFSFFSKRLEQRSCGMRRMGSRAVRHHRVAHNKLTFSGECLPLMSHSISTINDFVSISENRKKKSKIARELATETKKKLNLPSRQPFHAIHPSPTEKNETKRSTKSIPCARRVYSRMPYGSVASLSHII